jgi:hypothetical protein
MDKNFRIVAANKNAGAALSREEQYQRGQPLIQSEDPEYWQNMQKELDRPREKPTGGAPLGILGAIGVVALALAILFWAIK